MMVTLIIPAYNAEDKIEGCLDSIIEQQMNDIEIIVVDDGSTDSTAELVASYARKHKNISLLIQPNEGPGAARNKGIEHAKGDWISFIDADDKLAPNYLATLLTTAEKFPNSSIICCSCIVELGDGLSEEAHFFSSDRVFSDNKNDLYLQLMDKQHMQVGTPYTAIGVPWGKLYSRELIASKELKFNIGLRRMQVNIFNGYAFYYADKIVYIDKCLYKYNYSHFINYRREIDEAQISNSFYLIKERREFLCKTGLVTNEILYEASIKEIYRILFQIINEYVMRFPNARVRKRLFIEIIPQQVRAAISKGGAPLHFQHVNQFNLVQKIEALLILNKQYSLYRICWTLLNSRLSRKY